MSAAQEPDYLLRSMTVCSAGYMFAHDAGNIAATRCNLDQLSSELRCLSVDLACGTTELVAMRAEGESYAADSSSVSSGRSHVAAAAAAAAAEQPRTEH